MHLDNFPKWDKKQNGFYEVWYLKLNLKSRNKTANQALWLRFTTLSSRNGLKKIAETWAIFFDPSAQNQRKIAIKNTSPLGAYQTTSLGEIQIEDSFFREKETSGCVVSRGNKIEWHLDYVPNDFTFFHVPKTLEKFKINKSTVCKPNVNVTFKGWFSVNGTKYEFDDAPGCQGHIWGKQYAHDWAWAHCNMFSNSNETNSTQAVIEVLTARVKLANTFLSPPMSALFLEYKGNRYEFNHLRDSLKIRSQYSLTDWKFSADKGPLRIQGNITCDVKDLLAVTYEDTGGQYLYCNNSELASMNLSIYFNGKLDATLVSKFTTAFETVSRTKSPYVEVLV